MNRLRRFCFWMIAALAAWACKSGPEVTPAGNPEITSQELAIAEQGLTDFKVRLTGKVEAPQAAAIEKATYELVVDEKVMRSGEQPLGVAVPAGGAGEFQIEQAAQYVATPDELKAMDVRGGSLLVAVRGKLVIRVGQKTLELPFARAREIRVPRLPGVKLHELDAARYSDDEASATFYIGVENPNPFAVKLGGLRYAIAIAGKQLADGTRGSGEKVSASATGVFEMQIAINKETYGPDVTKLIKTLTLPYVVSGELSGGLFQEAYELKGDIKLNVSK